MLIRGQRNTVRNSKLAHSSGSILRLQGTDHRVVNNLIHSGNYGAKWSGAVALDGRRHVIAHNTIRHSGRDLVTVHGLMESLIERNDLSNAGWLTHDLGMIYGHNTCHRSNTAGNARSITSFDHSHRQDLFGTRWMNNFGSGDAASTGTSRHELRLGGGIDGIEQRVADLKPHTRHTLLV